MKRDSLDSVVSPEGNEDSYEDDDYEDDFDDPKSPKENAAKQKVPLPTNQISSKSKIPDRFEPKKAPSFKKSQERVEEKNTSKEPQPKFTSTQNVSKKPSISKQFPKGPPKFGQKKQDNDIKDPAKEYGLSSAVTSSNYQATSSGMHHPKKGVSNSLPPKQQLLPKKETGGLRSSKNSDLQKDFATNSSVMPSVTSKNGYQAGVSGKASLPITSKFPSKGGFSLQQDSPRGLNEGREGETRQNEPYLNEKSNTEGNYKDQIEVGEKGAPNTNHNLKMPDIYRESENNSQISRGSMLPDLKSETAAGNQAPISANVTADQPIRLSSKDDSAPKQIQTYSGFKKETFMDDNQQLQLRDAPAVTELNVHGPGGSKKYQMYSGGGRQAQQFNIKKRLKRNMRPINAQQQAKSQTDQKAHFKKYPSEFSQSQHDMPLTTMGLMLKHDQNLQHPLGENDSTAQAHHQQPDQPHIYIHQSSAGVSPGFFTSQNAAGRHKDTLSAGRKASDKASMVGRPYRVKTTMPFYDNKGVFQGVKPQTQKLNREEMVSQALINPHIDPDNHHNNQQQVGSNFMKLRSSSQTYSDPLNANKFGQQTNTLQSGKEVERILPKFGSKTIETSNILKHDMSLVAENKLEGHTSSNELDMNRKGNTGQSDTRSNHYFNQGKAFSTKSNDFRIVSGKPQKLTKEIYFETEVVGGVSKRRGGKRKQSPRKPSLEKIKQQILAESSSPGGKAFKISDGFEHVASLSNLNCLKHGEIIKDLTTRVDFLEDQISTKENLIVKLMDGTDEILEQNTEQENGSTLEAVETPSKTNNNLQLDEIKEAKHANGSTKKTRSKQLNQRTLIHKLKEELDLAYNILSQRDIELHSLRKQTKVKAYHQCNEERVNYLNECLKLQKLLKIYGTSQMQKRFRGIKITQSLAQSPNSKGQTAKSDLKMLTRRSFESSEENIVLVQQRSSSGNHLQDKQAEIDKLQIGAPNAHSTEEILEYQKELEEQRQQIQNKEFTIAELESHMKQIEDHSLKVQSGFQNEIEMLEKNLQIANQNIEKVKKERDSAMQSSKENEKLAKTIKGELEDQNSKFIEVQKDLKTKGDQLVRTTDKLTKLQIEVKDLSLNKEKALNKTQEQHNEELSKAKKEIEKLRRDAKTRTEKVSQLESENKSLTQRSASQKQESEIKALNDSTISVAIEQQEKLEKDLKKAKEEIADLTHKLEEAHKKEELNETIFNKTGDEPVSKLHGKESAHTNQTEWIVREELNEANKQLEQLRIDFDSHKESAKKVEETQTVQVNGLQDKVKVITDELEAQKDLVKEKDQKVIEITRQLDEAHEQNYTLEEELQTLKDSVQEASAAKGKDKTEDPVFVKLVETQGALVKELRTKNDAVNQLNDQIQQEKELSEANQTQTKFIDTTDKNIPKIEFGTQTDPAEDKMNSQRGGNGQGVIDIQTYDIQNVVLSKNDTLEEIQDQLDAAHPNDPTTFALRAKEYKLLKSEYEGLSMDFEEQKAIEVSLNEALKDAQAAKLKAQDQLDDAQIRIDQQQEEISRILEAQTAANKVLDKDKREAQEQQSAIQVQNMEQSETAKKEISLLTQKYTEEIDQKDKLIEKVRNEMEQIKLAHVDDIKEKDQLFEDQKSSLQTDIDTLKQNLEKANSEKSQFEELQKVLEGKIDDKDNQIIEIQTRLDQVQQSNSEIKSQNGLIKSKIDSVTKQVVLNFLSQNGIAREEQFVEVLQASGFETIWSSMNETEVSNLAKETILEKIEGSENANLKLSEFVFSLISDHSATALLYESSPTEEEIAFRKLRENLDQKQVSYKEEIFGITDLKDKPADDNDPEEVEDYMKRFSEQLLHGKPLKSADFVVKILPYLDNDLNIANRIASACHRASQQQDITTVQMWSFVALYTRYTSSANSKHVTMKELLDRAAKEREEQQKEIERLAEQQQAEIKRFEEDQRKKDEEARVKMEAEKEQAKQALELQKEEARKKYEEQKVLAQKEMEQEKLKVKQALEMAQEEARRKEEEAAEAYKKTQELLEARKNEDTMSAMELEKIDKEGFSAEIYRQIKTNADLSVIVNISNASLYNIRNQCPIYSVKENQLSGTHIFDENEPPYTSHKLLKDPLGRVLPQQQQGENEVEILLLEDFYGKVLTDMGLKRYVDIKEEAQKLESILKEIGAMAKIQHKGVDHRVIRVEVLIQAMRIHNYDSSGIQLKDKLKGVDFRTLDNKSIRLLNRFTKLTVQYQSQYQQKAKEGTVITFTQIINALFKGLIETKKVNRPSKSQTSGQQVAVADQQSAVSARDGTLVDVQLISLRNFYTTLHKRGIKKSDVEHANLSHFLLLNEATPGYVMYRKLVRVTEEFMRSHFLKSYGYTKKKLDFDNRNNPMNTTEGNKKEADEEEGEYDDEEEYYYDEEEEGEDEEEQKNQNSRTNPNQLNLLAQNQSKTATNPKNAPLLLQVSSAQNQQQNSALPKKDRVMPLNQGQSAAEYSAVVNQKQRIASQALKLRSSESAMAKSGGREGLTRVASSTQRDMDVQSNKSPALGQTMGLGGAVGSQLGGQHFNGRKMTGGGMGGGGKSTSVVSGRSLGAGYQGEGEMNSTVMGGSNQNDTLGKKEDIDDNYDDDWL